jgi:hypothetical protein
VAGWRGLDPDRVRRWAAAWTVLLASQGRRDDQADLDAWLLGRVWA